ncbi:alpha-1,2-fucosyltransferase [Aureliella helgolandensis]|uniref:Glycosyl transferase family 11 n=1 Tax=Aureliella helgolandensis TaxID=2527968 RepID=A0A518GHL7_9BACT|nr:alpha-1,2-fucosyltransferase [Aureliella helgolandensis]QDV28089.1 Glycosyl transferase family 11 [Aureliella helgolandensis]
MIIARIEGGLGNQMFQYAYGQYLAQRHQTELRLDLRSYAAAPQHGFLLDRYSIEAQVADSSLLAQIPRKYRSTESMQTSKLAWLRPTKFPRHKESPFGFQAKHLRASDNRYLVGYWQSEQFFPGLEQRLCEEFTLAAPLSLRSQKVADKIAATNSIAIHLRRGDYLSNTSAAQLFHHVQLDYYLNAITDWAQTQQRPEVFVFSNDIPWCKENVQLPWPVHFVDHNGVETAYEDMALMQQAACNVIANSTFSWWAAWLNRRPGKNRLRPRDMVSPRNARRLSHPTHHMAHCPRHIPTL